MSGSLFLPATVNTLACTVLAVWATLIVFLNERIHIACRPHRARGNPPHDGRLDGEEREGKKYNLSKQWGYSAWRGVLFQ